MKDRIYALIKDGESLREKSRYADALKVYKKALALSKKHSDLDGILDCTLAVADISRMLGDFDSAVENYEEALEACEALGNRLTAADCMVGIGLSLRAMCMWKKAVKFITGAKKIYEKEKDKKGVAFSLWAEAGAWRVAGSIEKAIEKFNESKKIFSALDDISGIGYDLCGLGGAHRIAGKYDESLAYYMEANAVFRKLKDTFGTAYSHCGIGNAYRMKGNYAKASDNFEKAEKLYALIGDIVSYSYTIWSVANLHIMKGDAAAAVSCAKKASANFRKTKDPRGLIYCDMIFAEASFMKGKNANAIKILSAAAQRCEAYGFKLEKCHCETLIALISSEGKCKTYSCYRRLGVNLKPDSAPFNIP
jgi:tetratricopeptide (TPR) repeat protein